MKDVKSIYDVPIRLTEERWLHITEEHTELAGYYYEVLETIQEPQFVFKGKTDELLALKELETGKYLVVVYKEINNKDGFVITAFITRRLEVITKRTKLWPQ